MKHVICPVCNCSCTKYGKNKSGTQRWRCNICGLTFTPKIDNSSKQLQLFLNWLFGKDPQRDMPGEGRTFRRNTSQFWNIWPLAPRVEVKRDVLYVDGIYLGRKACVLICCDEKNVLGWYLCRYEHSQAYMYLLSRIAEPTVVVSDGGTGFQKAVKKVWPHATVQRCVFHVFCQVKRYTTSNPNIPAGIELYALAKDLLHIEKREEMEKWINRFVMWMAKYNRFLSQMTYDEYGRARPTHERLIKAQRSIIKLLKEGTMFTYLSEDLQAKMGKIPSTNNQIEGGINSRLRAMLRDHRGLSVERRIKAVFWWCYMHSSKPLSSSEILNCMPTDQSIAEIYKRMSKQDKLSETIPEWGDAIVWNELHHSKKYPNSWD